MYTIINKKTKKFVTNPVFRRSSVPIYRICIFETLEEAAEHCGYGDRVVKISLQIEKEYGEGAWKVEDNQD